MKILTAIIFLLTTLSASAQTYTQMQWGMNKGVTPYAFGANINGTWSNLGTVSPTGAWSIPTNNIPGLWRGSVAAEAFGANPLGTSYSDAALDAAVAAAGGGCVTFGAGQFWFLNSHSYSSPVCILGVGNGVGPGPAAHSNTYVTEFMIASATNVLLDVTTNIGSHLENFRCNTAPSSRPATTNSCIRLTGGDATVSGAFISGIATTQVARPIQLVKPNWPVITNNYFDTWAGLVNTDAALYCKTDAVWEGSCGFIAHNYFFGTGTSGVAIYSEVGYTDIHDNTIMAPNKAIEFAFKNYPAGYTKIHDNTIENFGGFGNNGLIIRSDDGSKAGYVMIQNNEFFPTSETQGSIVIADYPSDPAWLDQLIISGNSIRENTVATWGAIRVGAGKNVQVVNNSIREEGVNSPYGIIINGAITSAGIIEPFIVKDNTLTGAFTNKYQITNATNVVWSDMTGSTVAAGGSQLPTSVGYGSEAVVTDGAAALTWGATVTGGGTDKYKVFFNGSNWTVQGK